MHKLLLPMFFPVLGAHVSAYKFKYSDNTWKELCGMMANLVGDSGCNKGQFSNIVEAINRNFREHDKAKITLGYCAITKGYLKIRRGYYL